VTAPNIYRDPIGIYINDPEITTLYLAMAIKSSIQMVKYNSVVDSIDTIYVLSGSNTICSP